MKRRPSKIKIKEATPSMTETKQAEKNKEVIDVMKELNRLATENNYSGLELFISFWDESLKVLNKHTEYWFANQANLISLIKNPFGLDKSSNPLGNIWGDSKLLESQIRLSIDLQKSYAESITRFCQKSCERALDLTKRNLEKGSSLFEDYLNLLKP